MASLSPTDALSVRDLRKRYDDQEVVAGINFSVPSGTCFGLLGPNGAGKTTTLRCCLGLTTPDAGQITLNGHDVPQHAEVARQHVGVVPQFDNIDPDFSVAENLMVYGRYFGIEDALIRDRIPELLDFAGLSGKESARIQTLSGGMKRRLTLARAGQRPRHHFPRRTDDRPRPAGASPDLGTPQATHRARQDADPDHPFHG